MPSAERGRNCNWICVFFQIRKDANDIQDNSWLLKDGSLIDKSKNKTKTRVSKNSIVHKCSKLTILSFKNLCNIQRVALRWIYMEPWQLGSNPTNRRLFVMGPIIETPSILVTMFLLAGAGWHISPALDCILERHQMYWFWECLILISKLWVSSECFTSIMLSKRWFK